MPCIATLNDLAVGTGNGTIVSTQQQYVNLCGLPIATVGDQVQVTGPDGPDVGQITTGCDFIRVDGRIIAMDGSQWVGSRYTGVIRSINSCCFLCCESSGGAGGLLNALSNAFSFQVGTSSFGSPFSVDLPDLTPEQIQEISNDTGIPSSKLREILQENKERLVELNGNVDCDNKEEGLRSSKDNC